MSPNEQSPIVAEREDHPFFAYAVLMNRGHMAQICPDAQALGRALLHDYRVIFPRTSGMWLGGIPSLQETKGALVWGVLWEVCPAHRPELDRYQGFLGPDGDNVYAPFPVVVEDQEEHQVEAFAYRSSRPSRNSFQPSPEFVDTVVRAAREFEFPEDYIAALERLA
jgi:hypothetical protein